VYGAEDGEKGGSSSSAGERKLEWEYQGNERASEMYCTNQTASRGLPRGVWERNLSMVVHR
jgi:hypothetical protein